MKPGRCWGYKCEVKYPCNRFIAPALKLCLSTDIPFRLQSRFIPDFQENLFLLKVLQVPLLALQSSPGFS